jgi:hypothetical protein
VLLHPDEVALTFFRGLVVVEMSFNYLAGSGGDEEVEFFAMEEVAAERTELLFEGGLGDAVLTEAVSARQQNRSY